MGSDTFNYWYLYDLLNEQSSRSIFRLSGDYEVGFLLYTRLCSSVKYEFQLYLGVTAFISLFPVLLFYGKKSEDAILSISIFLALSFFRIYFSGIRQGLAMALVIPAYYFCKEKRLVPFLMTVLMAFMIHNSAMILLLMYPLYWIKFDKNSLVFIFPGIMLVYALRAALFSAIVPYMGEKFEEAYGEITETGAIMMLLLMVLFMVFAFLIPNEKKLDRETIAMRNFLVLSTFIQIFSGVSTIAMRINYYYFLFIPLLIPKIITLAPKNVKLLAKLGGAVISIGFIGYYFYGALNGTDKLELYPYLFYWLTD